MQAFELSSLMLELESLLSDPESDPNRLEAIRALIVEAGPQAINDAVYLIKEIEGQVETIKTRIGELQKRKASKEATIMRVREMLLDLTDTCFSGKIKTQEFTVSAIDRRNLDISVGDANLIPEAFLKREVTLDKTKIKNALKAGEEVPGVLATETVERGLRIV